MNELDLIKLLFRYFKDNELYKSERFRFWCRIFIAFVCVSTLTKIIDYFNPISDLAELSLFHLKIKLFFKVIVYKSYVWRYYVLRYIMFIFCPRCRKAYFSKIKFTLYSVRLIEYYIKKLDPDFISYVKIKFYEKWLEK